MNWRALLIDWPVRLFNWWWTAYGIVLALLFMVIASMTFIVLVLYALGIRWGW